MSAETLRRAASPMRERAEAATPGPWGYYGHSIIRPAELKDGRAPSYSAAYYREDAEHIASWHPAVALAVADWLDWTAADYDEWVKSLRGRATIVPPKFTHALAVARAYLGETA